MTDSLPEHADAVVIGGGVIGCSVLYHLAKAGLQNAILLERHQIGSGTTWHAAALVTTLRTTSTLTRISVYTADLYAALEEETGQSTGFRRCGNLNIASTPERFENLKRTISSAHGFGIEAELVGPSEIKEKWPLLRTDDLHGAIWTPRSGRCSPTDVCQALLKGARARGARYFEETPVSDFEVVGGKVRAVRTPRGRVRCDVVINCTGLWGRQVASRAGVAAPLHACEHFYLLTKPIAGTDPNLPVVRDGDSYLYIREEVGGLLVGCFEPNPKPLPLERLPQDSSFVLLEEDWAHFEPMMSNAIHRVPALETAEVRTLLNGPESFTPDHNPLLGESPEVRGFYNACGMNSSGIGMGGGIGWVMADWIIKGRAPIDVSQLDTARFERYQSNNRLLKQRIPEVLSDTYSMPWPYKEPKTARDVRRTPVHATLKRHGASMAQVAGWERPRWFGPINSTGEVPEPRLCYGRPDWFKYWEAEHIAARQAVALFDQSTYGKLLVQGRDAELFLQRLCTGDIGVGLGKVVHTLMLNEYGGIESDVTVTRTDETAYLIVTGSQQARRDAAWLRRHIEDGQNVVVTDVTCMYAALAISGPRSRELLSSVSPVDFSNAAFPFATAQEIEIGLGSALALRVSYSGELGWELYVSADLAEHVFDTLIDAGQAFDLRLAGSAALGSLRIEKTYRSWGHDIGPTDTPAEAGMMSAVRVEKSARFLGQEAVLQQRETAHRKRLVAFVVADHNAYLYGTEAIYREGKLSGLVCSATFGHSVGSSLALGWVTQGDMEDAAVVGDDYEIEVAGKRCQATAHLLPFYDPKNARLHG
jgi:heterotetrameric sarcosine oxidase gamma subunit